MSLQTLTGEQINAVAQGLHNAELERKQIQATTVTYPGMTIADAYAIQHKWMEIKKKEGRKTVGHKVGLTSKVMQRAMNIDEPDSGTLLDDMVFGEGSTLCSGDFLDPKIEVELAFVLKNKLEGSDTSVFDVLDATSHVIPALELIAARTYRTDPNTGYKRTVRDTIADNAANAGIILGNTPIKPDQMDLRWVGALLYKNGVVEDSGVAAAVLNHPAHGVAWLARKYAQHDMALLPGQIILSGSFTSPMAVSKGDTIHADFNNLGSISCNFK